MTDKELEERKVMALEKIASWVPTLTGAVVVGFALLIGISLAK